MNNLQLPRHPTYFECVGLKNRIPSLMFWTICLMTVSDLRLSVSMLSLCPSATRWFLAWPLLSVSTWLWISGGWHRGAGIANSSQENLQLCLVALCRQSWTKTHCAICQAGGRDQVETLTCTMSRATEGYILPFVGPYKTWTVPILGLPTNNLHPRAFGWDHKAGQKKIKDQSINVLATSARKEN